MLIYIQLAHFAVIWLSFEHQQHAYKNFKIVLHWQISSYYWTCMVMKSGPEWHKSETTLETTLWQAYIYIHGRAEYIFYYLWSRDINLHLPKPRTEWFTKKKALDIWNDLSICQTSTSAGKTNSEPYQNLHSPACFHGRRIQNCTKTCTVPPPTMPILLWFRICHVPCKRGV